MNIDDLNQKALAVLVGEAIKPNDPANLRNIITNHTKLLSKATDSKAKEFHRTAIANAKEKLKSLGEEVNEEAPFRNIPMSTPARAAWIRFASLNADEMEEFLKAAATYFEDEAKYYDSDDLKKAEKAFKNVYTVWKNRSGN